MSDKKTLHLSIDSNLTDLAKTSGLNLSQEFEEWIRIRLNQNNDLNPTVDTEMEIAKHKSEILRLEQEAKVQKTREMEDSEREALIEKATNALLNWKKQKDAGEFQDRHFDWNREIDTYAKQLQFVFKKRLNINLNNLLEARELIIKKLKEKGIEYEIPK